MLFSYGKFTQSYENFSAFTFIKGYIADKGFLISIFERYKPEVVVNFAALIHCLLNFASHFKNNLG